MRAVLPNDLVIPVERDVASVLEEHTSALVADPERHAGVARDVLVGVQVELEGVVLEELLFAGGVDDALVHRVSFCRSRLATSTRTEALKRCFSGGEVPCCASAGSATRATSFRPPPCSCSKGAGIEHIVA